MRKIYWIWIILAVIALGYSLWNFLRPISSEETKQTFSPTTSANEKPDYKPSVFDETSIPPNAKL